MKWIVCQLGARMHYAVPRILESRGMLSRLFTDLYAPAWLRGMSALMPAFLRQVAGRYDPEISRGKVTPFSALGIEYAWRRKQGGGDLTPLFLEINRRFGEEVCAQKWEEGAGVYVFNAAGLEILRRARLEGRRAVLEQTIAPSRVERRLMAEERALFPEWEEESIDAGREYIEREEQEWELADTILCGSQFVVEGIRECGGPVEKCVVVSYGVDGGGGGGVQNDERKVKNGETQRQKDDRRKGPRDDGTKGPKDQGTGRPIRVLMVGTVGLRKGAPYVLEAAKTMRGRAEFRVIGSVKVQNALRRELMASLDLRDRVPRSEMPSHFAWADVFLLPSLCEGSATVTYEAMGAGLPVVCTSNTGSLVRDGIDGFIVPVRDTKAIMTCLDALLDPVLRARMSVEARQRARDGTVEAYGKRLVAALGS
jgi:glycosyltransferase involved in cell wall biosynthesis